MKYLEEEWRAIPGYKGYSVSNLGRVRQDEQIKKDSRGRKRQKKENVRALHSRWGNCFTISLRRNRLKVHRLVYQAFNGNLIDGMIIDHIDNNPYNNTPDNLQQITKRQNSSKDKWRKNPISLYTGVFKRGKRWGSSIYINKKRVWLGTFDTQLEASKAYQSKLATL